MRRVRASIPRYPDVEYGDPPATIGGPVKLAGEEVGTIVSAELGLDGDRPVILLELEVDERLDDLLERRPHFSHLIEEV